MNRSFPFFVSYAIPQAQLACFPRETGNPVIIGRLERAVSAAVLENWFTGEELTRVRRVQGADLETITVSEEGEEAGGTESVLEVVRKNLPF